MKVKELKEKLEQFDENEEIKLRVWYVKGKADAFFDFDVRKSEPWDEYDEDDEEIVVIESKVDIDDFLTNQHGCIEYRNY